MPQVLERFSQPLHRAIGVTRMLREPDEPSHLQVRYHIHLCLPQATPRCKLNLVAQNFCPPNHAIEAAAPSTPAFRAIWVPLHLESDELPEPTLVWGLSSEDVNDAYAELFQSHWDSGVWPYVRLALPGGRYIEVEYATGVEFQTRVWVGFDRTPR